MQIRLRGALLLAGCALFHAMLFTSLLLNGIEGNGGSVLLTLLALAVVGLTAAMALIGSLEVLTGIAFSDLSRRWSALSVLHRVLFGLLLTGLALALALAGLQLYRWMSL